jgi:hypothetical protein
LFHETRNKNSVCFGLFQCFEPISKQRKQKELFRNKPKQPKIFRKIPKYALYQTVSVCLLFVSVQSKYRNSLFRYRSKTNCFKRALLRRFTATALQQCHKLLDFGQLGGGTIAVHYARVRALYTPNSDELFNAIFLCTLPENVRTALASLAELPSDELVHAAVQLQHTFASTASLAAATALPPSPAPTPVIAISISVPFPPKDTLTSSLLIGGIPSPATAAHTAETPAQSPQGVSATAILPAKILAAAVSAGATTLLVKEQALLPARVQLGKLGRALVAIATSSPTTPSRPHHHRRRPTMGTWFNPSSLLQQGTA